MNRKITSALLVMAGLVFTSSCEDKEETQPTTVNNTMTVSATLNASQEVQPPKPNTSTATGTLTGTYDKVTRELKYTINYQGFTAVSGHFHLGSPTENGATFVTFDKDKVGTSPITGTATISEADAAKLLASAVYVNLHSATYPAGEIRGNVSVK